MDNIVLTERMKDWLKELYLEQAKQHISSASDCHIFALGSEIQEEAIQFDEMADEHREFAHILECLAKELDLE